MKTVLTIALLCFTIASNADIPYMPLRFELTTDKESYLEGEMVEFIMTITNADTSTAYPLLLPHTQNTGNKLVYLSIYDRSQTDFLQRAYEDRNINMWVHDTGSMEVIMLQPREKRIIKFYWNDFENYYSYHTQLASHHMLNVPLFAGEYWVLANYNPQGIPAGDTLYHYYSTTNDDKSGDKLNMWAGGVQPTCMLKIRKAPLGKIKIQGTTYNCVQEQSGDYYGYYMKDSLNKDKLVHATNGKIGSYDGIDYEYTHFDSIYGEYLRRFPDGKIQTYWKYKDACPTPIYKREFSDKRKLVLAADRWPDGSVRIIKYHDDGRINTEEVYTPDGKTLTTTLYHYTPDKKLKKKQETVQENPCIMDEL